MQGNDAFQTGSGILESLTSPGEALLDFTSNRARFAGDVGVVRSFFRVERRLTANPETGPAVTAGIPNRSFSFLNGNAALRTYGYAMTTTFTFVDENFHWIRIFPQLEMFQADTEALRAAGGVLRLTLTFMSPSMITIETPGTSPALIASKAVLPTEPMGASIMVKSAG